MHNLTETFEKQNTVIRIQSEVISELVMLLMQHITANEADSLPCIRKINEAAELRTDLDRLP